MINKVLARCLYVSGLFDSKLIVKHIVWRKKQNKGAGAFINPRWRLTISITITSTSATTATLTLTITHDYIYIYIYMDCYMYALNMYIYIYIYIVIHTCICKHINVYISLYKYMTIIQTDNCFMCRAPATRCRRPVTNKIGTPDPNYVQSPY